MSKSEPKSRPRRKASTTTRSTAPKAPKPRKPKAPKAAADRSTPARLPSEVKAAIAAALDKKAVDPVLLDLRNASAFTDFFLIFTGANLRQVQAIADGIEDALRKKGTRPALVEGSNRAEWVLIDYFDFIVHIFTPGMRDFYALERLWGDAERVELSAT
jgi:ribosome-associated protein